MMKNDMVLEMNSFHYNDLWNSLFEKGSDVKKHKQYTLVHCQNVASVLHYMMKKLV